MSQMTFVLGSTAHGPMIFNRNDFCFLTPHEAFGVGCQLLQNGAYDIKEMQTMKEALGRRHKSHGPGIIMLDCGANIGVNTVEAAKFMDGWGSVTAFEAQERLYYALCGNIVLNNCNNASAMLAAVARSEGQLAIPKPNYTIPGSYGSLELRRRPNTEFIGQAISYDPGDMVEVPAVSIDALGLNRLDFIKLDVEGMEIEVLEGGRQTISDFKPTILVEWVKTGKEPIRDFLGPLGYEFQDFSMNILAEIPG